MGETDRDNTVKGREQRGSEPRCLWAVLSDTELPLTGNALCKTPGILFRCQWGGGKEGNRDKGTLMLEITCGVGSCGFQLGG